MHHINKSLLRWTFAVTGKTFGDWKDWKLFGKKSCGATSDSVTGICLERLGKITKSRRLLIFWATFNKFLSENKLEVLRLTRTVICVTVSIIIIVILHYHGQYTAHIDSDVNAALFETST
jgi:uncharacterized protein YvpB